MRDSTSYRRVPAVTRAGQSISAIALSLVMAVGCGNGSSSGRDAAAGSSGQGGSAANATGGTTGSGGSAGTGGSGTGGALGTGGSSAGSGGSTGGGGSGGRGGRGGEAGAASTGSGGVTGSGGRGGLTGSGGGGGGGRGGSAGNGGVGGTTSPCQAVVALDRSCSAPADCFAGTHVTNCCGQVQFIGFNNGVKSQFQTLEAACDATYPPCGCAGGQPTADDASVLRSSQQAGVTCLQGTCTTFVPDCGQPCATGTTCFTCVSLNQTFAACTTMCNDSTACANATLPLCQMGSSGNRSGKFCTTENVRCDTR